MPRGQGTIACCCNSKQDTSSNSMIWRDMDGIVEWRKETVIVKRQAQGDERSVWVMVVGTRNSDTPTLLPYSYPPTTEE
eukprot:scaffold19747_cov122-Amphora_coffeaeformis.AAC.1